MTIKILGTGCQKCSQLLANAEAAVSQTGCAATVQKVEDLQAIMRYGVMQTPALVVDDVVKARGKVLSVAQIVALLEQN